MRRGAGFNAHQVTRQLLKKCKHVAPLELTSEKRRCPPHRLSRPIVVVACGFFSPNREGLNTTHIQGTHVPVEEPCPQHQQRTCNFALANDQTSCPAVDIQSRLTSRAAFQYFRTGCQRSQNNPWPRLHTKKQSYASSTPTIFIDCGSTITIWSPTWKYSFPRHVGSISTMV
jgi:hypothetical protein